MILMGDSVAVMRSPRCCYNLQSNLTACAHHMHLDKKRYSAPAQQKIWSDSRSSVKPCEHGSSVVYKRKKKEEIHNEITADLFSLCPFLFPLSGELPVMSPWLLLWHRGALGAFREMLGRVLLSGRCKPSWPPSWRQQRWTMSKR